MDHIKILAYWWAIVLLPPYWWAWYYVWVALPNYNSQKLNKDPIQTQIMTQESIDKRNSEKGKRDSAESRYNISKENVSEKL